MALVTPIVVFLLDPVYCFVFVLTNEKRILFYGRPNPLALVFLFHSFTLQKLKIGKINKTKVGKH